MRNLIKKLNISLHNNINISIRTIGDKPGHVQSGQYLWPASIDASNYIIDNWDLIKTDKVLELGAGCGLTGLVISKLPHVTSVVFTDYDNGTLSLFKIVLILMNVMHKLTCII